MLAGAVILHRAGGQVAVEHALPLVEDGDGLFLVVQVADAEVVRPVHRRTGDIEKTVLPERHRFVVQVAHAVVHGGEVQRRRGGSSVQSISTLSSRLSSRFLRVIYRTSHDSIIFYIIV